MPFESQLFLGLVVVVFVVFIAALGWGQYYARKQPDEE